MRNWTQLDLAKALGNGDPMLVSRWERGVNRPGDDALERLAEVLGHDLAWFYADHTIEEREAA